MTINDVTAYMGALGKNARIASRALAASNSGQKNQALNDIADTPDAARPA